MRRIIGAAAGMLLVMCGMAAAQSGTDHPVVVELYTSQGCSSCPPADQLLANLAARDDVIALGLHVDYWDYIGWKDSFANPQFSDRQRAYARHAGARTVYTPQMIVAGMDHLIGARPAELDQLIRRFKSVGSPVSLDLSRRGSTLAVRARAAGALKGKVIVQLVRYAPNSRVEIGRGENAGRVIDYANVVTAWQRVEEWDGTKDLALTLKVPGDDRVAVIIQEKGPGRILAAATAR